MEEDFIDFFVNMPGLLRDDDGDDFGMLLTYLMLLPVNLVFYDVHHASFSHLSFSFYIFT